MWQRVEFIADGADGGLKLHFEPESCVRFIGRWWQLPGPPGLRGDMMSIYQSLKSATLAIVMDYIFLSKQFVTLLWISSVTPDDKDNIFLMQRCPRYLGQQMFY